MGTCTLIQQHPSIRRKIDLHSTTDSAPQLIVLMVAKLLLYQSQWAEVNSRCKLGQMFKSGPKTTPIHDSSNTGPKTTPTNHGPREKQSDKEQRSPHQFIKNKNLPDKAAGRIIEFPNRLLKYCTKVKTNVDIRRLLQLLLLCKALSRCLHPSRSK